MYLHQHTYINFLNPTFDLEQSHRPITMFPLHNHFMLHEPILLLPSSHGFHMPWPCPKIFRYKYNGVMLSVLDLWDKPSGSAHWHTTSSYQPLSSPQLQYLYWIPSWEGQAGTVLRNSPHNDLFLLCIWCVSLWCIFTKFEANNILTRTVHMCISSQPINCVLVLGCLSHDS